MIRDPATEASRGSAVDLHDVEVGEVLDGFHVDAFLHEGGMATLYRVSHPEHEEPLVMKVPKLGPASPPESYASFETEQRILSKIHGPHFPRLIAVGDMTHCPYLVMEYIEGHDLQDAEERAPLSPKALCAVAVPLCRAIHELHRRNAIHLDLKPSNVLNRPDGRAVLIDFGIAHHASIPDMIDAGFDRGPGTLAYLAPEQIRGVRGESRSDIYALGVILYRLATGGDPFGDVTALSLKRRLYEAPAAPRSHNPAVPPWLQEIILRCLETCPTNRYATAKEVAHWLLHPDGVHLTERARRTERAHWLSRLRQRMGRWRARPAEIADLPPYERVASAPHVLVALDLGHASEELKQALRNAVRKFARNEKGSYFTFLSVVVAADFPREEDVLQLQHSPYAQRQVDMRNWLQPLRLARSRVNFQVLKGNDAAAAIVDYARSHVVDHIIVAARASSALRRFLGAVSSKVVAEAPCSVTVVRSRRDAG